MSAELEKSMRLVEVRKLWQPGNASLALEEACQLSLAFMDYALHSGDYRFLNAALKLNDRLREELQADETLWEIEKRESDCLETLKKRLGLLQ